jgi:beta-phosphoglucomutase
MIQSIFFDFNGVIIDDESLQMRAYQEIFSTHEINLTEQWYLDALGMDDKTFIRTIFKRADKQISPQILDAILEAKTLAHRAKIEAELPFFPGVRTFLKATARVFPLGLVSMARKVEVEYVLEQASLQSLFTVVVTAGDVSACKPAPDCYLFALESLNEKRRQSRQLPLLPGECLAIEDAPPGIASAREAGMRTLGVTNTVTEAELRAARADVVTRTLADWTVDAVRLIYC